MSQPSPLTAVRRNAQALRDSGDLSAARAYLEHALESARPALGEDHPDVLQTAQVLAGLHREADDPMAARRVLEQALAAGERRLGHSDALMLALSFELGAVAEELGNRHEARKNFGRVAAAGPAVLGEDHWQVRAAREYVGEPQPVAGHGAESQPPAPVTPPPVTTVAPADEPTTPLTVPPAPPVSAPPVSAAPPAPPEPVQRARSYPAEPIQPAAAYPFSSAAQSEPYPAIQPYPTIQPPPQPPAPAASPSRGRGVIVAAAVAATAAAIAATLVGLAVLADNPAPPGGPERSPTAGPVLGGDPPTDLRLRDDGSVITVSWNDPTPGTVPFIVAGGRAGQTLNAMATINAGETSYTVNGLSPRLDYCFTVLAVYSTDRYATSGQVCTARSTPTPR